MLEQKDRVKVLSLESMLGFAVVKQRSNSLAQRPTFLLKILLWKHKPKNFLLCYITKCSASPVMFRNGGSNQSFVTWFVEIGGVYEITWNHGKTQVANILEDGLPTGKWKLVGPELPWQCLPWAENTNSLKLYALGLYQGSTGTACHVDLWYLLCQIHLIYFWNSSDPGSQLNKLFCTHIILQRTRDVLCICNTWRTGSWVYFGRTQRIVI